VKASCLITAGGLGIRFGRELPKQFQPLAGAPMIVHTIRAFEKASTIDRIVVVLPAAYLDRVSPKERKTFGLSKVSRAMAGGETRQDSVGNGLEAIDWNPEYVAIHDAARCLVTPELIDRTVRACEGWDGAIAALPVGDTLKRVKDNQILQTEPRENLWAMQTPQVFRFFLIRDAYRKAKADKFQATDDAALAERSGARVRVVEGDSRNSKITYPEDLAMAECLLTAGKP
jgi:2-C-methyl-D-erythritol 4-phosphate cytidylyltransferase